MYTKLFFKSDREASFRKFRAHHAFSLYMAGNMADTYEAHMGEAAENRRHFLREAGFENFKIVRAIPQHGERIVSVGRRDEGKEILCDGLLTVDPTVALSMCVGDCPPVIVTTRRLTPLLLLHIGTQNAGKGFVGRALDRLWHRFTIPPDRLLVAIGPGICVDCYDAQWVVERFGNIPTWKDFLPLNTRDGTRHCDLRGYIAHEFRTFGVKEKNLFIARECTSCSRYPTGEFLLDSHHRAKTRGREGRFLAVAAMARQPWSLKRFFGYSASAVQPQ